MPELPEVEHVVRALRRSIVGRKILQPELKLPRISPSTSTAIFARKLRGTRIVDVDRRGKHILIKFDSARVLMVHLRMTGKFVILSPDQPLLPYSHVIFYLDNDRRLVYCDMRQFGRMRLAPSSRLATTSELKNLAPEPLSEAFSVEYLRGILGRSRRE